MAALQLQSLPPDTSSTITRLEDQIEFQKATIEALRAGGHVTLDAEKHLQSLQKAVALLR